MENLGAMVTMGETTSRHLASAVRAANAGNNGGGAGPAGKYYGGWAGGGGGSFGRARTGRGDNAPVPPAPSARVPVGNAAGTRPAIKKNSEGVKALWDTLPPQQLPRAPAKGGSATSAAIRPRTAPRSRTQCATPAINLENSHAVKTACELHAIRGQVNKVQHMTGSK